MSSRLSGLGGGAGEVKKRDCTHEQTTRLGIKLLASSASSGHKDASCANSNGLRLVSLLKILFHAPSGERQSSRQLALIGYFDSEHGHQKGA